MSSGWAVYSQTRFSYFQVLSVLSGALPRFDLHLGAKENLSRVRLYAAGAPCDALFPQSPIVLHAGHCFWKRHLRYVPHTRSIYKNPFNCHVNNGLVNRIHCSKFNKRPMEATEVLSLYWYVAILEKIRVRRVVPLKNVLFIANDGNFNLKSHETLWFRMSSLNIKYKKKPSSNVYRDFPFHHYWVGILP